MRSSENNCLNKPVSVSIHKSNFEFYRAFIKKFSVIAHAIPDYHPGEDIFDLSTSGKIFNQHNLDLRSFDFIPQNPIEKLLLR